MTTKLHPHTNAMKEVRAVLQNASIGERIKLNFNGLEKTPGHLTFLEDRLGDMLSDCIKVTVEETLPLHDLHFYLNTIPWKDDEAIASTDVMSAYIKQVLLTPAAFYLMRLLGEGTTVASLLAEKLGQVSGQNWLRFLSGIASDFWEYHDVNWHHMIQAHSKHLFEGVDAPEWDVTVRAIANTDKETADAEGENIPDSWFCYDYSYDEEEDNATFRLSFDTTVNAWTREEAKNTAENNAPALPFGDVDIWYDDGIDVMPIVTAFNETKRA